HRRKGRFHTGRQSRDDVGCGASRRVTDDIQYGLFTQSGIKFGERGNQSAYGQPHDGGIKYICPWYLYNAFAEEFHVNGFGQHKADEEETRDDRQHDRYPVSQIQSTLHLVFFRLIGRYLNEQCSDDGSDNAHPGDHHGEQDGAIAIECVGIWGTRNFGHVLDNVVAEYHGSQYGSYIRPE